MKPDNSLEQSRGCKVRRVGPGSVDGGELVANCALLNSVLCWCLRGLRAWSIQRMQLRALFVIGVGHGDPRLAHRLDAILLATDLAGRWVGE